MSTAAQLLDALRDGLGSGIRTMRTNRGFTLAAILTLALGIGANTAIFTVIHAILLQPLAYRDPDRLVRISGGATAARFDEIRSNAKSLTEAGANTVYTENVTLVGVDGPEPLVGARVTGNFLSILGLAPLAGRTFTREEESPSPAVAMISAALWRRRFASDPAILGGAVRLDGGPCTIVGILPDGFQFPQPDLDIWRPWQPSALPLQSRLNSPILAVFGRLKPALSLQQASAEMALINKQYALTHPGKLDAKPDRPEPVLRLKDQLVRDVRSMLWMLFGAVGLVLVIACSNVASLLLARARARSREFAIRAALGASRGRLIGQLLIESVMLALAGGTLGVMAAGWALSVIARLPGLELPRTGEIHLNLTVLVFAFVASTLTGVLFGLAPSLYASRSDLVHVMKPSTPAVSLHTRNLLVIGQVALSMVLLIGAALLIESLARLRRIDPGFQSGNLLTMQLALPPARADSKTADAAARFEEIVRRVESVPGVRNAAVMLTLPMTGWAGTPVHVIGQPELQLNQRPIAILQAVTPGYFRTMGIQLRRGRDFEWQDSPSSPFVAVINEAAARRFWPSYPNGEDPVGHLVLAGSNPTPLQIVGIVADVRQAELASDGGPGIYRPRSQTAPMSAMFAVRTEGDPLQYVNAIRAQVQAIDRDQSVTSIRTMSEVVDASEGQRKGVMILLSLFAAVGLLLAVVGIYGVVAYSVVQRTAEVGIRMALGAQRRDILRLVLRHGFALTAAGVILGVGGALALTRAIAGFLFEVSATDPATYLAISALLLAVTLAASYIPARRAMRIDPTAALRGDTA